MAQRQPANAPKVTSLVQSTKTLPIENPGDVTMKIVGGA